MSDRSSSLAAVQSSDTVSPTADSSRHALFRYLTADESGDYLAIMDLFSATLLTDLSAVEVTAQLAERDLALDRDLAEARCRQLVTWGNLVPSLRDAKVSTVAEYLRSRSRYQVSKLGGRVHREAVAILHASDGAREVARELLGQIVQSLDRILALLDRHEIDADALAGEVTTVFGNQRLFTDSVRDFYAYLAGILSRYDLGGEEYAQFKELLLVYIDLITADVNRHAPAVSHRIGLVLKLGDPLLEALATLPGLTLPDGTPVGASAGQDTGRLGRARLLVRHPRRFGPGTAARRRRAGAQPAHHQRQAPARLLGDGFFPARRLPPARPVVRRRGRRRCPPALCGCVRRLPVPAPPPRPGGA